MESRSLPSTNSRTSRAVTQLLNTPRLTCLCLEMIPTELWGYAVGAANGRLPEQGGLSVRIAALRGENSRQHSPQVGLFKRLPTLQQPRATGREEASNWQPKHIRHQISQIHHRCISIHVHHLGGNRQGDHHKLESIGWVTLSLLFESGAAAACCWSKKILSSDSSTATSPRTSTLLVACSRYRQTGNGRCHAHPPTQGVERSHFGSEKACKYCPSHF